MHLKNYSLITKNNITSLTPAYDLLNTTIVLKNADEEIALPIRGKKRNITRNDLVSYFAVERLGLNERTVEMTMTNLNEAIPIWEDEIAISFLSDGMKEDYLSLLRKRCRTLGF